MLRGASFPRITRPTLKGKNLTINTTVEGHKVQVTQINSSLNKSSFHVKTSQKAAQITINSTPKSFRFCVQPTKTTNLKNEQPELVFLVNRRHNSNGKEEKTEDKQSASDKQNPLSTNYHTSLPVSKHSPEHMFEPIPKAAVMPSLWFFLVAILLIKEMLSRQSEGIANDLVTLFRRYEEAKASQDEERIRQAETDLIQFVNMGSLMFMMGNPKLSSPELMQEISNFLLQSHSPQLTELVLTLFSAVVHSSRASFAQADLPLSALATKFADKDILRDTTVVSSLSQVLDTLVIDGYDLNKIASATGMVTLVDLMAHHPDATISTRASHILRAFAQNASTAPAVQDNVATLIHVIKRKENTESVIYAKEAIQGLLAASGNNPEFRSAVENQLYNGTVSKDLANEIIKFERPVSFSKIPKITTELTLGVLIAIGWGYIRWTRALKKKGVSAEDIKQIVKYRTALTAGVTAVAVGTSILEDNVIAHHSEVASDVVAFIGWPLFLAVTPFIIVPSFLSAIASAQAFDKICDEHRR